MRDGALITMTTHILFCFSLKMLFIPKVPIHIAHFSIFTILESQRELWREAIGGCKRRFAVHFHGNEVSNATPNWSRHLVLYYKLYRHDL